MTFRCAHDDGHSSAASSPKSTGTSALRIRTPPIVQNGHRRLARGRSRVAMSPAVLDVTTCRGVRTLPAAAGAPGCGSAALPRVRSSVSRSGHCDKRGRRLDVNRVAVGDAPLARHPGVDAHREPAAAWHGVTARVHPRVVRTLFSHADEPKVVPDGPGSATSSVFLRGPPEEGGGSVRTAWPGKPLSRPPAGASTSTPRVFLAQRAPEN